MVRRAPIVAIVVLLSMGAGVGALARQSTRSAADPLARIDHLVVIYQENHSFDTLWGGWPAVDGLGNAAGHSGQVGQDGRSLGCLPQLDVNLTSPPLPVACHGNLAGGGGFDSRFENRPFALDDDIPASAATCFQPTPASPKAPANGVAAGKGSPGGCTRDLVHRFYQEQYQIDGGRQDRYVAGSDAGGLAMGWYRTENLPLYRYLSGRDGPNAVVADHFFAAAFGGSFLNHHYLVAAAVPTWPEADRSGSQAGCATGPAQCDLHSVIDANGMPSDHADATDPHPLYTASATPGLPAPGATPPTVKDNPLTEAAAADGSCSPSYAGAGPAPGGAACGDFAINTIQPATQPYAPGTPAGKRLPVLGAPTIGDALTGAGVSWAWYAGGWDNAAGITTGPGWTNGPGPGCADPQAVANAAFPLCPDVRFQFHHQPFNYYASFADDTADHRANRAAHLQDEADFRRDLAAGTLPAVSFVKPLGVENEHPGYASQAVGDRHLVELVKAIRADGHDWPSTAIVVTYDENGGAWDHVAPPRRPGVSDRFGPGTRVPAVVISPLLRRRVGIDHREHDTTSILATIEHRFGLSPLAQRDAAVSDLGSALR
jgi:acid phosphatase